MNKRLGLLLAAAVWLAGCSTPASRIRHNPALFGTFPADVQQKVRAGRIEIGFTPDMVRLALGTPNRVVRRESAGGLAEVWSYVDYDRVPGGGHFVSSTFYVRGRGGMVRSVPDVMWVESDLWYERDRVRIEFRGGKVAAIDSTQR